MSVEWHPEKYNKKLHKRTVGNLWKAAFLVERDQKILATEMGVVDTGRLRSSITSSVDERRMSARIGSSAKLLKDNIIQGKIGPDVYYAIFVVLGTYKMRARDFMTPALDMNRRKIIGLIGDF